MNAHDDRNQIVLCGLGGQGIVFLSRLIAGAALIDGREILTSETHGMSQRGGAVESHLKIGGYRSSIIRRGGADAALALDASRVTAAKSYLGDDGACFVNAPDAIDGATTCDATAMANELGHAHGTNLVLLGFAVATQPALFPTASAIRQSIEKLSPAPAFEANAAAFARGGAIEVTHE